MGERNKNNSGGWHDRSVLFSLLRCFDFSVSHCDWFVAREQKFVWSSGLDMRCLFDPHRPHKKGRRVAKLAFAFALNRLATVEWAECVVKYNFSGELYSREKS